jgi:hypothetical protein
MKLDRKSLNRLLALNDAQLRAVIDKLATEYGLDLSAFRVRPGDLNGLRNAIRNATDEDLLKLTEQLRKGGKG